MEGLVHTADGVALRYNQAGAGRTVVLVHGWSQSAALWRYQIADLSTKYRVIAYDQRGHGASDKPEHGYKVHRLARDLHELLTELDIDDAVLVGHSMGCSVAWAYLELFDNQRLGGLALVDGSPCLTANPTLSRETRDQTGSLFTPAEVIDTCNALDKPERDQTVTRTIIDSMLTSAADNRLRDWIVWQNHQMPGAHAAALLYNHAHQDWRCTIPRITLPTLVIAGAASIVPLTAAKWITQQITRSQLEIIEKHERGSHFAFLENPDHFNALLTNFVG